jgi:hypothetical protein
MFPVPIAFLNDELKAELGMKVEERGRRRWHKVMLIQGSNGSWRQGIKNLRGQGQEIRHRNAGRNHEMAIGFEQTNEEPWLQWKLWHGHEFEPSNVGGTQYRSIFEWTAGPRNKKTNMQGKGENRVHSAKYYNCAIFELEIRAFDIQSGWRDAYERQHKYMRRDIFIGKLNPEKFSQRM